MTIWPAAGESPMAPSLIELDDVEKHFPVSKGLLLARTIGWIKAVDGISLSVEPGRTLSLVGESGCGKSTVIKLILSVEKPTAGRVLFMGQDLRELAGEELKAYRASVQAVFQDPWGSLNPRMRVDAIIGEPLIVNDAMDRGAMAERIGELLVDVGLKPQHARLFPHEFSGGQRQRIAVARALALNPRLVVLDEPVSALDVSIRAQIINLLKDLQDEHQLSYGAGGPPPGDRVDGQRRGCRHVSRADRRARRGRRSPHPPLASLHAGPGCRRPCPPTLGTRARR